MSPDIFVLIDPVLTRRIVCISIQSSSLHLVSQQKARRRLDD